MDLPRRLSLVDQVAALLEQRIAAGVWREWLPNERTLASSLQVSRNTLRAALADLARRRIVVSEYPRGTRILVRPPATGSHGATGIVGLLSPAPIGLLRPNVALIIDALRALLAESGRRLHFHAAERVSVPMLERLVAVHRHDCWLLVLATDQVKRWFHQQGLPCVVSGSCAPGIPLPFVDLDYRAIGRHAAGRMMAAGHRRLGMFVERPVLTGRRECELGFAEGVHGARHPGVSLRVIQHQGTPAAMSHALAGVLRTANRPTALLVVNPHHYLFAHTWLQRRGVRVPEDLSLVCVDDDPFLAFVEPTPSRYVFDAPAFARRLFDIIVRVTEGRPVARREVRIIPRCEPGSTLAAPPAK